MPLAAARATCHRIADEPDRRAMNYRHAFHAGNFADVVKHAVLCRILIHLRDKPAAFRVIDSHAGAGRYELTGPEASRTGEWRDGIERLLQAELAPPVRALLAPYLDAVAALNPGSRLVVYPGSPALAQALLRRQDRLIACEFEPQAAAALKRHLRGDARAKAIAIDGWTALAAYVPPVERRGLVLVDPPFEQPDEFSRLAQGLATAHRKWPTGSFLLWYPVKEEAEAAAFARRLTRSGIGRMLRVELIAAPAAADGGLRGCGLIAVNPPWTLHDELQTLLPGLAQVLSRGAPNAPRLEWLAGEASR
jgi:23S rRNA (adenine2030-N6)-methyltransferase